MAKCRDHTRHHQKPVVGRNRTQEIAENKDGNQQQQSTPAIHPCRGDRQKRRAKSHTKGIARHQQPGIGDAYTKIKRHIGQKPHDDKLGRANPE